MIIDIVCTFSATTIEAEATSISLVLTFPVTQAPSNICDEVKTCLGISSSGSNTKYLNEKGLWTTPAGGGGGSVIIEATKAEFLALVAADDLTFPATYKITDIENGLFVETLSENTFNPTVTMLVFLPNYIPNGIYMGQYHSALGEITDGEIYTWGEFNYLNESGGALTPDTPSPNVFDSANRFTQLPKLATNFYTLVDLVVVLDKDLNVTWVQHPQKLNSIQYYTISQSYPNGKARAALAQLNQRNNIGTYIGQNEDVVIYNCRVDDSCVLGIFGNKGTFISEIYDCFLVENGSITGNIFQVEGKIYNILGNVNVRKNVIGGSNSTINDISTSDGFYIDILHNELHDNNRLINITGTGDNEMYIWDNHLHENNDVDGWSLDSTFVKFSNSHLNNDVNLTNFTFNDGQDKEININFGHNFTIDNLNNLNINSLSAQFPQETNNNYNLTGFTSDIVGESIEAGKGWFTYKRNFATSPLLTTDTILHNIIPIGARITNLVISGSANGNSIQIGLSSDDESLLVLPTSLLNNQLITVSDAATENRSLLIKALMDPITTGEITVKCEFVC